MLTDYELNEIGNNATQEEVIKLVSEVKRLRQYTLDYNASISQKIDTIEENMLLLEAENQRLLFAKGIVYVERDACIGLIAQLAMGHGFRAGTAPGNKVVVDLPSGQVSWEFNETEAHLFSELPPYPNLVEELPIEETYRRVMNPGLSFGASSE